MLTRPSASSLLAAGYFDMKTFLLSLLLFTLPALTTACPNFTGLYEDPEGEKLELQQLQCSHIKVIANHKMTRLILDGQIRPHEQGDKHSSFVRAYFLKNRILVELIIQDKSLGQLPSPHHYSFKSILTYELKKPSILHERTQLFDGAGRQIDFTETQLERIR